MSLIFKIIRLLIVSSSIYSIIKKKSFLNIIVKNLHSKTLQYNK